VETVEAASRLSLDNVLQCAGAPCTDQLDLRLLLASPGTVDGRVEMALSAIDVEGMALSLDVVDASSL